MEARIEFSDADVYASIPTDTAYNQAFIANLYACRHLGKEVDGLW